MPPLVQHDMVKVTCDSVDRCSGCIMIHGSLFSSWFSFSQKKNTKSWWHDSCCGLYQTNMFSYIWRTKCTCHAGIWILYLAILRFFIIESCSSRNVLGCDLRDVTGSAASNLKTRVPVLRGSDWKKHDKFSPELRKTGRQQSPACGSKAVPWLAILEFTGNQ